MRLPKRWVDTWGRRRALLGTTTAIVSFFMVATVSLLVEDLTDFRGWITIAAIAIIASLLFLWTQASVTRDHGTLYYVQFLEDWMRDLHSEAEEDWKRSYGDEKIIVQRVIAEASEGLIDVADEVALLSNSLHSAIMQDDTRTGYAIAPNLLVAPALSLGYRFYAPQLVTMLEFNPLASKKPGEPQSWLLEKTPLHRGKSRPKITPNNSHPGTDAYAEVTISPTFRDADTAPFEVDLNTITSVLIVVHLTASRTSLPRGLRYQAVHHVGVFDVDGKPASVEFCEPGLRHSKGSVAVDFQSASKVVAGAISQALIRYPDATVYIAARMPKTVGLAVGHFLAESGRPGDKVPPPMAAQRPWSRLVPLLIDQLAGERPVDSEPAYYLAARVDQAQPARAEMIERIRRDGLEQRPDTTTKHQETLNRDEHSDTKKTREPDAAQRGPVGRGLYRRLLGAFRKRRTSSGASHRAHSAQD